MTAQSESVQVPKLGKPGAGLPWPHNWLARLLVPRQMRRAPWEEHERFFEARVQSIRKNVQGLSVEQLSKRILVPRLPGLEDSSRYWSVAMTLEHVIIVSDAMADLTVALSQSHQVPLVVDIAKVKPKQAIAASEAVDKFNEMVARVQQKLTRVQDRTSKVTHRHPWFGRLTAHQWHWLIGRHMGVHSRQIKQIVARL